MIQTTTPRITKISYRNGSQTIDITEGIEEGSLDLYECLCKNPFEFGKMTSDKLEFWLYRDIDLSGKEITVTQTIDGASVPIFSGIVDECKRDNLNTYRNVVAYDKAESLRDLSVSAWWETFWTNKTSTTLLQLLTSLCSEFSLTLSKTTTVNDNLTVFKSMELEDGALTFGDILTYICELMCVFPHINRSGALELIAPWNISSSGYIPVTDKYEPGNTEFEEYTTDAITAVYCIEDGVTRGSAGTGTNAVSIVNNPLLYDVTDGNISSAMANILTALNGYSFTPATIQMIISGPDLPLGSMVSHSRGKTLVVENHLYSSQLFEQEIGVSVERTHGVDASYRPDMRRISGRVATAEASLEVLDEQIQSKVSTTTYNSGIASVNGRIDTTNGNVTSLAGRVTTAESTITQQAGEIASKVSQTTYNSDKAIINGQITGLTGRVSTAETNISANTAAINLRATKTEAQTYANSAADALNQALQTTTVQIVKNGNLQISDDGGDWAYNWLYSGNVDDRLRLDNEGVNGSSRSFYATTNSHTASGQIRIYSDEKIPIDTTVEYEVSVDAKGNHYVEGEPLTDICYVGLDSYDADKLQIVPSQCMFINGSTTALSQDLKNGDTVIHFASLAGWINTSLSHQKGCIFWNYKNSFGYAYPEHTYSRNSWSNLYADNSSVDRVNNTITLSSPWNHGTIPAGTRVSQSNSGGTYIYCTIGGAHLTKEWKTYSGIVSGMKTDGTIDNFHFRQGTSYVRFVILAVYNSVNSEGQNFTNMSIKPSYQKQIDSLSAEITVQAGQIESKVSQTDYNGQTIASKINQSASSVKIDAKNIDLNGAVTANNYFKILTDGSMEALAGKIGGWTISNGKLTATIQNVYLPYNEKDASIVRKIMLGEITPDTYAYTVYDITRDGTIDFDDLIWIVRIARGLLTIDDAERNNPGFTRPRNTVTIEIDPSSADSIKFITNSGIRDLDAQYGITNSKVAQLTATTVHADRFTTGAAFVDSSGLDVSGTKSTGESYQYQFYNQGVWLTDISGGHDFRATENGIEVQAGTKKLSVTGNEIILSDNGTEKTHIADTYEDINGAKRSYKSSTINATAGQTISVTVPNGCTGTVHVSYMSGSNYVGGGIIAFDSFKTGSNVDGSVTTLHNHASGITAPTWVAQRLDADVLYIRATCSAAITYKIAVEMYTVS